MRSFTGLKSLFAPGCAFLLLSGAAAEGQVVINELSYDDWTTDQPDREEFVELFNGGNDAVSLKGWTIFFGGSSGIDLIYEFPEETVIQGGGYLVVGGSGAPGVDLVLGDEDLLGNGPNYIVLATAGQKLADAVIYELNKGTANFPPEALTEGGIWGNHVLVPGTRFSLQRWFDGWDSDENGADFGNRPWTPGRTNNRAAPATFESDFNDRDPETDLPLFPGSFVGGRVVDPTVISGSNPNSIPPSPDGGNVLIAWDPAGGGNLVLFEAEPTGDLQFEAWVYLDATLEAAGEMESWSIGLGGTSGTFYNFPILYDANGNTGVTWTYQVTDSGATLYLVDEGAGGTAAGKIHLAEIPIQAGTNDGWQRLWLEVRGNSVVGYFGGTYGSTGDGILVEGVLSTTVLGNFYIGYREALQVNGAARPPTLDRLFLGLPENRDRPFSRGDSNADGQVDLTDAIFTLGYLFTGDAGPSCLDSADANDNGIIDIADAIALVHHLFGALTLTLEQCEPDPTGDPLGCDAFAPCK